MARPSRRRRGTITIEDVARAAGVSAMTVSRVINREKNVRDGTRDSVLATIEAMRYSPNTAARSLAAGDATHIGLLYSNPSAAYLSQFLVGALECARGAGCHLVIEACESDNPEEQRDAARSLIDAGVEGVLLPPPLSESVAIMDEFSASDMPMATVAMGNIPSPINVRMNDFEAAAEMTRHLIGLGHRRIAHITGNPNQIAAVERERGFRTAASSAGLSPDDVLVEQGLFTFHSGLEAAERLLTLARRPTAIFAGNDDMAAASIGVAHRHGLDVPADLTVVGFDDTSPAITVWPELTTIRQPVSAMAAAALDMLLGDLRARRRGALPSTAEKVLGHELIIRNSSAPPRTSNI